ncbi:hypothetical protein [Clostridium perfringens]|uniref:hypothetical protein n=1 Tax=Clostridium perfringens TaxID=1502 RepID=UPI001B81FFFB|nr:hypothetical protein [Clostridium perfringens]MDT7986959.1 hypothetical protein [Clostridium perfringens]HBC2031026.1 hypothetical protein [Clostridium perfringens]HBC2034375.1 hypothetical protein [Clostridium perfringens]HBC2057445.1 hypothetical protein [Clostridium perfringens]HBC2071654.1 hypothetical protein [Clostridium perfringens]
MLATKIAEQFIEPIEIINKIKKLDKKKITHIATVIDTLYMVQLSEQEESKNE